MKNTMRYLFVLFICLIPGIRSNAGAVNAVALKSGCRLVQKPAAFFTSSVHTAKIDDWTVQGLTDQTAVIGWCSGAGSVGPYVFVYELSEEYLIDKLVFNNICQKEYRGICAKNIKTECSVTSATSGFQLLSETILPEQSTSAYEMAPVKARWIRLTISSNYGNNQWTELMEFEAWGNFADASYTAQNVIGVWNTNFDWVSIKSNVNGYIYGCYKWQTGELFSGTINRRVFEFKWSQKGDRQSGWCVLVINKEGTRLNGVWGFGEDRTVFGYWEFTKGQSTPYPCTNDEMAKTLFPPETKAVKTKIPAEVTKAALLNLVIEVADEQTKKNIAGTIEITALANRLTVSSADGIYSTHLEPVKRVIVKTKLLNYFPSTDTLTFSTEELTNLYITHIIYLSKMEAGRSVVLKNITFEQSRYELLPTSYPELDRIADLMKQYPAMEIELAGHTDNQGDAAKNVTLSEQRVKTVKEYLVSKGIAETRIKGVGYGGKFPIASNAGEQTRKLNRRVEFKIIKM